MSTQPKALRRAAELEACPTINYKAHAAELRRLHASCEDYAQHKQRQDQRVLALTAQRDALLEALKQIAGYNLPDETAIVEVARAAIKMVEEGK